MLGPADRKQFEEQGFVVVPEAFSPETIGALRGVIDRTVGEFDPAAHRSVFSTGDQDQGRDEVFFRSAEQVEYFLEEDALDTQGELIRPLERSINKMGHALHDHIPELGQFCRTPSIGQAFRALGHVNPLLWQTMVIFKQPGIGGEVRWHQDASYLISNPATVIGLWIALEDADRNNGCLMVSPGGHRGPLRELYTVDWDRRKGELHSLDTTPWPGDELSHAVEVKAGSAVFFSDHLPHGSTANRSDRSRVAMTLHVADENSTWDRRNWIQRPALGPFRL